MVDWGMNGEEDGNKNLIFDDEDSLLWNDVARTSGAENSSYVTRDGSSMRTYTRRASASAVVLPLQLIMRKKMKILMRQHLSVVILALAFIYHVVYIEDENVLFCSLLIFSLYLIL